MVIKESGIPEAAILDLRGNHDAFNMAERQIPNLLPQLHLHDKKRKTGAPSYLQTIKHACGWLKHVAIRHAFLHCCRAVMFRKIDMAASN